MRWIWGWKNLDSYTEFAFPSQSSLTQATTRIPVGGCSHITSAKIMGSWTPPPPSSAFVSICPTPLLYYNFWCRLFCIIKCKFKMHSVVKAGSSWKQCPCNLLSPKLQRHQCSIAQSTGQDGCHKLNHIVKNPHDHHHHHSNHHSSTLTMPL